MNKVANHSQKTSLSIFLGFLLLLFNGNGIVSAATDAQIATSTPVSGATLSCVSAIRSYTTCMQVSTNTVHINFNVTSSYEGNDIGYRVGNSVPSVFCFWFHWDAGGFWYRYGFDANNTSQARGFSVGLNGLGFYSVGK